MIIVDGLRTSFKAFYINRQNVVDFRSSREFSFSGDFDTVPLYNIITGLFLAQLVETCTAVT